MSSYLDGEVPVDRHLEHGGLDLELLLAFPSIAYRQGGCSTNFYASPNPAPNSPDSNVYARLDECGGCSCSCFGLASPQPRAPGIRRRELHRVVVGGGRLLAFPRRSHRGTHRETDCSSRRNPAIRSSGFR